MHVWYFSYFVFAKEGSKNKILHIHVDVVFRWVFAWPQNDREWEVCWRISYRVFIVLCSCHTLAVRFWALCERNDKFMNACRDKKPIISLDFPHKTLCKHFGGIHTPCKIKPPRTLVAPFAQQLLFCFKFVSTERDGSTFFHGCGFALFLAGADFFFYYRVNVIGMVRFKVISTAEDSSEIGFWWKRRSCWYGEKRALFANKSARTHSRVIPLAGVWVTDFWLSPALNINTRVSPNETNAFRFAAVSVELKQVIL